MNLRPTDTKIDIMDDVLSEPLDNNPRPMETVSRCSQNAIISAYAPCVFSQAHASLVYN
jgi:hypothetical protein